MRIFFAAFSAAMAGVLAFTGCSGGASGNGDAPPETAASSMREPSSQTAPGEENANPAEASADIGYIESLVQETVSHFYTPGMSEYEMAKAAFDYMIETTSLVDPVGLDLWRIRGDYAQAPSYVENRSLSVLQFRIGMCEDYAAALTMLLRGMGLEAEYVPGLTYSTQGELVDHAWTVAKIDGSWYHLDCQLEQNISRRGSIRYKYFMRGDATMAGSHRWGQNLIDSGLLTSAQNAEIADRYIFAACPQDYPTPEKHAFPFPEPPDTAAIQAAADAEVAEYERVHGPLEPLELNVIPPVFALEGYGPQD